MQFCKESPIPTIFICFSNCSCQEKIGLIDWTVSGKVKRINSVVSAGGIYERHEIEFEYDAMGNRIKKTVYHTMGTDGTNPTQDVTYYSVDATGNVMATYNLIMTSSNPAIYDLELNELPIYGSSRLGMKVLTNFKVATNNSSSNPDPILHKRILGKKWYELSNHLGNVLTVITDRKRVVEDGQGAFSHYISDVVHSGDYYLVTAQKRWVNFF